MELVIIATLVLPFVLLVVLVWWRRRKGAPKSAPLGIVVVGPKHPIWNMDLDDDDWSGATFDNWLRYVKDRRVELTPPLGYDMVSYGRLTQIMFAAGAKSVKHVRAR